MEEQKFTTVIKPKTGWFDLKLKEVYAYRDLIFLFVKRNFVSKYKQTILGPAWAVIQPLLTTVVFTLVFGNIAGLAPGGKWHTLYMCNPVTPIVNLFRYAYLGIGAVEWKFYFIGWATTFVVLLIGVMLFNRVEKTFMDTV